MTQRERKIAVGLLGGLAAVVVIGGFWKLFWEPLKTRNQAIANLRDEVDSRETELRKKLAERRELNRLKALSLPTDPEPRHQPYDLAWSEYDKYLRQLTRDNRLKGVRIYGTPPAIKSPLGGRVTNDKKPVYSPLTFTVDATGELTSIVALLEDFYRTPLLHQVKALTIKPVAAEGRGPAAASRELALKMTVEALLIDGAPKRGFLMPDDQRLLAVNGLLALRRGLTGLPLVPGAADSVRGSGLIKPQPLVAPALPGEYGGIARKNIFFAPTPPAPATPRAYPNVNINEHIRLTSIVQSGDSWEAFVYDVFNNVDTRLWAKERPLLWLEEQKMLLAFRTFAVYDNEGEKKTVKVYKIDPRDVYFYHDGSYYRLHLGETVADALNRVALTDSEIEELGLPPEPEKKEKSAE